MILIVLAATFAYAFPVAYRVGHSGRHARVWSPPRPTRLLFRGAHARPRRAAPHGKAVTA